MDNTPNSVVFDEKGRAIAYEHVGPGDNLKIVFKAERGGSWLQFSPADLHVWLNGQPLTTLRSITLDININDCIPRATIGIDLQSIDIDADSMLALETFIRQQAKE